MGSGGGIGIIEKAWITVFIKKLTAVSWEVGKGEQSADSSMIWKVKMLVPHRDSVFGEISPSRYGIGNCISALTRRHLPEAMYVDGV